MIIMGKGCFKRCSAVFAAALTLISVLAGCDDGGARLFIDGDTFYYDPDDAFDYESYFAELRERSLPDTETTADAVPETEPETVPTVVAEDTEAVSAVDTEAVTDTEAFTTAVTDTAAVITAEAVETADTDASAVTSQPPEADAVYWVKSGEVWHVSAKCPSLSRSKEILSGTVEAAVESSKARVCKRCGK